LNEVADMPEKGSANYSSEYSFRCMFRPRVIA
jgi:hypothetical protein